MTTITEYLASIPLDATTIDLHNKNLIEVPDLHHYTNLKCLRLSYNKINNLENIPESVEFLYCCFSEVSNVTIPKNVKTLYLTGNNITNITLPEGIRFVDIRSNMLKSIVLPESVECADLYENEIIDINFGENLQYLKISLNPITELPPLKNLRALYCNECLITKINFDLHSSNLEELYCLDNKIKKIDLPETIRVVVSDIVTLNILGDTAPIDPNDFVEYFE